MARERLEAMEMKANTLNTHAIDPTPVIVSIFLFFFFWLKVSIFLLFFLKNDYLNNVNIR